MIRVDGLLRRDRPRRHEDPGGDRRSGSHGARLGAAADADERRPGGRRGGDGRRRCATRPAAAKSSPTRLPALASARRARSKAGSVTSARNLPGWEGSFPLAATLEDALGCTVAVGNDVQVATDAEFKLGAGQPYSLAARSLLGHGRRRRAGPRRQAVGRARRRRRDRPRRRRDRRRAMHVRADAAAWRPTPAARRWKRTRAKLRREKGTQDRPVQADEGARTHAPDERHLGACARA